MRGLFDERETLALIERTYFHGRDSLFVSTRTEFEAATEAVRIAAETYDQAFFEGAPAAYERRADETTDLNRKQGLRRDCQ